MRQQTNVAGPQQWTNKEIAVLRENYIQGGTKATLPFLPKRTQSSIYNKALELGLRAPKQKPPMKRKKYEPDEKVDALIVDLYRRKRSKGDVALLAKRMMRSAWWVYHRAAELGLANMMKSPEWSQDEDRILAEKSCNGIRSVQRALKIKGYTRSVSAIKNRLTRKGLSIGDDANYYNVEDVATLMGSCRSTVVKWITEQGLEAKQQIKKGTWRIPRRGLRHWISTHQSSVNLCAVDKYWFIDLMFKE